MEVKFTPRKTNRFTCLKRDLPAGYYYGTMRGCVDSLILFVKRHDELFALNDERCLGGGGLGDERVDAVAVCLESISIRERITEVETHGH